MKYNSMLVSISLLVLLLFQSLVSAAEQPSVQSYDFQIGSRLLLGTKSYPTSLVATLVSLNENSLVLVNDYGAKYKFPKSSIRDAYISHGKVPKSANAMDTAGNWALIGAVLGGGLGYFLANQNELRGPDSDFGTAMRWGGISVIGFGIWGAIIGASSNEEIWKAVPMISVSVPIK